MKLPKIKLAVEQVLQVNLDTSSRCRDITEGRMIVTIIALSIPHTTVSSVARLLNRHHSSIWHYVKVTPDIAQFDKKIKNKLEICLRHLGKSEKQIQKITKLAFLKKRKKKYKQL